MERITSGLAMEIKKGRKNICRVNQKRLFHVSTMGLLVKLIHCMKE